MGGASSHVFRHPSYHQDFQENVAKLMFNYGFHVTVGDQDWFTNVSFNVRSKYFYKYQLQCETKYKYISRQQQISINCEIKMQIIQTRGNIIRKTVSELGAGLHSALWIQHSSVRPVLEARDKGMKWFWNVCGINVEVEERMQLLKIICFKIRPPWEDIFWDYHRCDNPYVIIHRYHLGELKM